MKRLVLFLALLCSAFLLPVRAQQAPDVLGLDKAAADMEGKMPIAIAAAMEASRAPDVLPGMLSYYFGYGQVSKVPASDLGNELQPRIGDLMLKLGYAPVAPQAGSPGRTVQAELKNSPRVTPKYVIVPTVSFENMETKQRSINLAPLAGVTGDIISNRTARDAVRTVERSSQGKAQQTVKATFALRYYNRDGVQIRVDEACPQEITDVDAKNLSAAMVYQTSTVNKTTLKPLADKLMTAMQDKLNRPGATCPK